VVEFYKIVTSAGVYYAPIEEHENVSDLWHSINAWETVVAYPHGMRGGVDHERQLGIVFNPGHVVTVSVMVR
jgi:hypothetical protein